MIIEELIALLGFHVASDEDLARFQEGVAEARTVLDGFAEEARAARDADPDPSDEP